jgi:hypothetical protein
MGFLDNLWGGAAEGATGGASSGGGGFSFGSIAPSLAQGILGYIVANQSQKGEDRRFQQGLDEKEKDRELQLQMLRERLAGEGGGSGGQGQMLQALLAASGQKLEAGRDSAGVLQRMADQIRGSIVR